MLMSQVRTVTRLSHLALLIAMVVLVLSAFAAAETSVQQNSGASVEQNANVEGGDMQVEQESNVRTETDDALVEQRSEQSVTKEAGEPAQVERNVERNVEGDNDSITFDIDQQVTEGDNSLSASQDVDQQVDNDRTVGEDEAAQESTSTQRSSTNAETDTTRAQSDTTSADVNPMRQGGSLVLLQHAVEALQNVLQGLVG